MKSNNNQNKIILIVLVLVVVLSLFLFNQSFSLFVAEGISMQPTFSSCTVLVVDFKFPPEKLEKGDLVIVDISQQETQIEFDDLTKIAHRVIENNIQEKWITTRGDNNLLYSYESSIDGFFSYESIIGKVVEFQQLPDIVCNK